MRIDDARDYLTPEFRRIKRDVLREDPDEPIIFHLTDIINRKGPFEVLRDDAIQRAFIREMSRVIRAADYSVITVFLDKMWLTNQPHWKRRHPYHYTAELLFERYALYLQERRSIGDIMPESRDRGLDDAFQKEFERVRLAGLDFISAVDFCRLVPVSKLKFRRKEQNIEGLQLCDILTYPSHQNIRKSIGEGFRPRSVSESIGRILDAKKYHRSRLDGRIAGFGVKCIP